MTVAERQAKKLLTTVSKTLQGMGTKVGQAASAASKRKYMIAGLAALAMAGAAAQQLTKSLGSTSRSRPAARKATRTRRARSRRTTRRRAAA